MAGCHPFLGADIDSFLALAGQEGWICARWELDFLLRGFPQGCFVWRKEGGARGYLTSIRYGRSGWIGNLLVHPEARRHGIGRGLMERAVSALLKSGVETVWLTASEEGAGLYRKLGFAPIDSINRWVGKGALRREPNRDPLDIESIRAIDRVGWGDRRETLLLETCGRGQVHTTSGGFICGQEWGIGTQIGPWGCLIGAQAGQLLDRVLAEGEDHVFLDVPAGNFAATELMRQRGYTIKGSTLLMYLGDQPLYQPGTIYALASMGSMG
jgi:ribosomal protein S18 acetylase RimI-like enzyme